MDYIVSHMNADFDAFASMLAAMKLYPGAVAAFPGSQEKKLRRFIGEFGPFEVKNAGDAGLEGVSRLVVVDTKSARKIGPFAALLEMPGVEVHLYDHHPHGPGDIRGAREVLEDVGATATIMAEILRERDIAVSPLEATVLLLGIYEETGSLLYLGTTERDLAAAAWLLRRGGSLRVVAAYLRTGLTLEEIETLSVLTHAARHEAVGGLRVTRSSASIEDYQGDAAQFAHVMMEAEETDALFLLLRMQGKVVIIGRSRAPELSVAEVLEEFGGGGHPTAASATVGDTPLEIVDERLAEAVRRAVRPGRVAADIMTRPVVTVASAMPLREAALMMTRYGVNVLPVTEDGRYMGILTRESAEKALFHGLSKSKALEFASTDAMTAGLSTPVRELESAMIERNQRFVPVIDGGSVVGAITRTDLLRVLYEDYLRRSGVPRGQDVEPRAGMEKNLAGWLRGRLEREVHDTLMLAGETARSLSMSAYLVGGSVRDLLMGRAEAATDLDIVVEGEGIAFARRLCERLDARLRTHERFGTAKIMTGHVALDIATARTEYYDSPAALPTVEISSIKKDLYRRDFTINTLAVNLTPPHFGKLVDFFGGRRDIKDKTIRVLHDLSFVEDPTRAFRAVRFAERFGFKVSRHTDRLIRSALGMDLFSKLSGTRLFDELALVFEERDPAAVLDRLDSYGLLSVIHPSLALDDPLRALLRSVHDTLLWFRLSFIEERVDAPRLYLMALLTPLGEGDRTLALSRLAVQEKISRSVLGGIARAGLALARLPLKDPAALYDLLHGLSPEGVLFVMAQASGDEKKMQVSRFLLELRKARPILTGLDLKALGVPPGPAYSRILHMLLAERIRGRASTREDEIRLVTAYLGGEG